MANLVFDRYYKITFKTISTVDAQRGSSTGGKVTFLDEFILTSDDSKDGLSALQVYGSMKKSLKSSGDSPDSVLNLNIVNLPADVNSRLNSSPLLKVSISLGYKNSQEGDAVNTPLIAEVFSGDVKTYATTHDGLNFVTTLSAMTGVTEKSGATINAAFRAGVPYRTVIKRIVDSFTEVFVNSKDSTKKRFSDGYGTVFEGDTLSDISLENDRAFEGLTAKVLNELCNELKVGWTLEDGQVHIYRLTDRTKVLNYDLLQVEPQNVIGGLGIKFETAGKNEKEDSTATEVTMNTFLDPRVGIQTIVNIPKSMDKNGLPFSGNYLPTAWLHKFKYRGGVYETSFILNRTNKTEVTRGRSAR